jgi:hypothetical protein
MGATSDDDTMLGGGIWIQCNDDADVDMLQ